MVSDGQWMVSDGQWMASDGQWMVSDGQWMVSEWSVTVSEWSVTVCDGQWRSVTVSVGQILVLSFNFLCLKMFASVREASDCFLLVWITVSLIRKLSIIHNCFVFIINKTDAQASSYHIEIVKKCNEKMPYNLTLLIFVIKTNWSNWLKFSESA